MTFASLLCTCPDPVQAIPGTCPACGGIVPNAFAWPTPEIGYWPVAESDVRAQQAAEMREQ